MKSQKLLLIFVLFLLFIFVISNVYSQVVPKKAFIEHISKWSNGKASEPDPSSNVVLINSDRKPQVKDVTEGMENGKKITVVLNHLPNNPVSHAVRVVAINLTFYNGTNIDNQTIFYNDAEVFDPTSNATYNLTFAYVQESNFSFLQWGSEWRQIIEVIRVYNKTAVLTKEPSVKFFIYFNSVLFIKNLPLDLRRENLPVNYPYFFKRKN